MPTLGTKPSTLKLSEAARHIVIPEGIVTTAWPRVVAQCAEMGVTFDLWQHGIGQIALGKRADGKYAATVGGVVLSIPRQVGKTFLVGMIIIALCILVPGLTVLWTAHRTRTATKTFQTIQGMVRRKKIRPHLADTRNDGIRTANGEQEVLFRNGSVIMFGARESGFGRGFDEVDIEVFDEGQILTEKALEDMVPAANQSRQDTGALLFFMGTPPRLTDPGEEFTNRRAKALSGTAKNMVYVEFSADADANLDDHKQWRKANPSFPSHTPVESMERMRENLTDDDSFRREALGIWNDSSAGKIFPPGVWPRQGREARKLERPVLAVDMRSGLTQSISFGVAGGVEDGTQLHLAKYEAGFGVQWPEDFACELTQKILKERDLDTVVVDGYAENEALIVKLLEAGVNVVKFNQADMANGAVWLTAGLVNGTVWHTVDEHLNLAVAGAAKKTYRDTLYTWSHLKSTTDITPLRAVNAAGWYFTSIGNTDYDVLDSVF